MSIDLIHLVAVCVGIVPLKSATLGYAKVIIGCFDVLESEDSESALTLGIVEISSKEGIFVAEGGISVTVGISLVHVSFESAMLMKRFGMSSSNTSVPKSLEVRTGDRSSRCVDENGLRGELSVIKGLKGVRGVSKKESWDVRRPRPLTKGIVDLLKEDVVVEVMGEEEGVVKKMGMNDDSVVFCYLCKDCTDLLVGADGNCLYEIPGDDTKKTVDIPVQYTSGCD